MTSVPPGHQHEVVDWNEPQVRRQPTRVGNSAKHWISDGELERDMTHPAEPMAVGVPKDDRTPPVHVPPPR